jgi:hypothetical protein
VGQPFPENFDTGFYRPDGGVVTGQWPGGSVAGKSWMGHIRDFAPDFVMVMLGANDLPPPQDWLCVLFGIGINNQRKLGGDSLTADVTMDFS